MAYNRVSSFATQIYQDDAGMTCVKYHDTVIVKFDNEKIILDAGDPTSYQGWRGTPTDRGSFTTKRKLNQSSQQFDLGYHVFQEKKIWYITITAARENVVWDYRMTATVEFQNGITILRAPDGQPDRFAE